MPLIFQHQIQRADLHINREALYLFGDNEERRGLGGLAGECRGEPNACGIVTKKAPSWESYAFWSDADFDRVRPIIDRDFEKPTRWIKAGKVVICPAEGVGQYRAKLPEVAPLIDSYIKLQIMSLGISRR